MTLTPDEEAEFTPINALAFDLVRTASREAGTTPPCWLCMSDEAKREARATFCEYLDRVSPGILPYTEEEAENKVAAFPSLSPLVARWREAEVEFKRLRAEGNPRAFFA